MRPLLAALHRSAALAGALTHSVAGLLDRPRAWGAGWESQPGHADALLCAQAKAQRGQFHELPELNGFFDDVQHYNDVK